MRTSNGGTGEPCSQEQQDHLDQTLRNDPADFIRFFEGRSEPGEEEDTVGWEVMSERDRVS